MGLYITLEQVRIRLIGKVRFTDKEDDENRMHESLANRLINEGEGRVEQDLSPRYFAPFQTEADTAFSNLPDRPTKETLRTLCEIQAVLMILDTDFGRGTVADADKYSKMLGERYKEMIAKQMAKKKMGAEEAQGWMYPPLPGLKLNYFNTVHDDGYMGAVYSTSDGTGAYPSMQINSPGESWWTSLWNC